MVVRARRVQLNTTDGASKLTNQVGTCVRRCWRNTERARAPGADSSAKTSPSPLRGVGTYGPLDFGSKTPLAAIMRSRIPSASSRWTGKRHNPRLDGSTDIASARGALDCWNVREPKICRWRCFRLQPEFTNSAANHSNNSGWVGGAPLKPRFSEVSTNPIPQHCCQIRLTVTRASKAACGVPGAVNQCAQANRRPVVRP